MNSIDKSFTLMGPKTCFKRIFKKFEFVRRMIFLRLRDFKHERNIILVYSMGKVGSSSVYNSLKKRLPFIKIFHLHFLSDFWLKEVLPTLDYYFHNNIDLGNRVLQCIREQPQKRLKIITLVREPFSREISDAFENRKGLFPGKESVDEKYLSNWMDNHTHEYTLNWFDSEFRNYTGFDIYTRPFDKERGYTIYCLENLDILCIKLEKLNRVYHEAFHEFLNLDGLSVNSENASTNKKEKDVYKLMRSNYKADKDKLDSVYSSKYMKHFYSSEEIEEFRNEWRKVPGI